MDISRPRSIWHGPHSTTGPASERGDCVSGRMGGGGGGGRRDMQITTGGKKAD